MKKAFSKILSFILCLCMIVSVCTFNVFAAEKTEISAKYYVKWHCNGTGTSPESPVSTVADAIALINAKGYGAGDTVEIYVMNDDSLTSDMTSGKDHTEPW